jgi:hypothetical protein
MKKLIAFAVGGLWTVSVLGEDLYECLGPDLVRSIVAPTTTNNDIPITSDIPQELADVILPAGVEWIGVVAGEMRMTAAFKTELPIAEAGGGGGAPRAPPQTPPIANRAARVQRPHH